MKIPISMPSLYEEDKQLAIKAIEDGYIANGEQIGEFENKFAAFCNKKYGVTCSNGTVALHLAIKALNLPAGAEVILPAMTIVSCLSAVVENNLTPIFCDSDPNTWNVDFSSIRSKITKKTVAVLLVDTYGLVVNFQELQSLKRDYPSLIIIEDASEAHGGTSFGKKAGSLGDISTFSFYANKIVTTGEGGIVLTDDYDTYQRLLSLRNLNFIDRKKYIHSEAGFNFRLTNLQCCLGLGQLQNIDKTIYHRKRIALEYNRLFEGYSSIQTPYNDENHSNVYWYYTILIKSNYNQVVQALQANQIDYRHFFHPLHKQPFFHNNQSLPVAELLSATGLILPTYNQLTSNQIEHIAQTIIQQL